jgi:hypothetical protein
MKKFALKTSFIFTGTFFVNAETKEKARKMVKEHCGLVLGGDIHTYLSDGIVDWDFPVHPKTVIVKAKEGGAA